MSTDMKLNIKAVVAGMTVFGGFYGAVSFANRLENNTDTNTATNVRQDADIKALEEKRSLDHDKLTKMETTLLHIDRGIEEIKSTLKEVK